MSINKKPSSAGLRGPTDSNMVNGQTHNPPRYAKMGGLSGPAKVAGENPFNVVAPSGKK